MGFFETVKEIFLQYYPLFWDGVQVTMLLALSGTILGLFIGLVVGALKAIKPEPRDSGLVKALKRIMGFILSVYIEFFRGTPMMVQAVFLFYGLKPYLGWSPMVAGVCIISVNTGAYMAEIIRSGIQSVDRGQIEGARSIGMTNVQTMFSIVLPQALRNAFPAVINEFVINIKDSSMLSVIMVADLFFQGNSAAGSLFKYTETFFIIALIYLCLTFITSRVLMYIEKRMNAPKKNNIVKAGEAA
ncbi:MAG TPA: amino acid ABC transporter permease [Candidatus Eubacterium pullicola]|uniref:Amino acid ABC transporter permease n=1 Tax=Gallibacter intestinalis TaxID=2779356 RepID=A0ABR9QXY7_9FIRM|nr:amino acid ABC transporter permease [Gallibacter intestinalis]MBE5035751.1 amino acid ABC transporter permease [Gallibacter intestinalis]HIW39840.1 amino acid ABC transporter permease [Candidatus Eubacterium pullicola]